MRDSMWIGLYLGTYAIALALMAVLEKFDVTEALFILLIAGGGFTALAWLVTRGVTPLAGVSMRAPAWALAGYFVLVTIVVTWVFSLVPNEPVKIALKLLLFVVIPILAFRMRLPVRMTGRDLVTVLVMLVILTAFQFIVGSGGRKIAEAKLHGGALILACLASFVWMSIEAGLTEEIAFRALLQTRLEEWTRSRAGGMVVAALLFGLIHAPGLYLRTAGTGESFTKPSLLFAIGYAIVVLSPMGLFLGYLWTRTRNILVLVLVHGAGDLIPNVVDVARKLGIHGLQG